MKKKQLVALESWHNLNAGFDKLKVEELEEMLKVEKSAKGLKRKSFVKRIQQRINGLNIIKHNKRV